MRTRASHTRNSLNCVTPNCSLEREPALKFGVTLFKERCCWSAIGVLKLKNRSCCVRQKVLESRNPKSEVSTSNTIVFLSTLQVTQTVQILIQRVNYERYTLPARLGTLEWEARAWIGSLKAFNNYVGQVSRSKPPPLLNYAPLAQCI
jgi:hypothetical protein